MLSQSNLTAFDVSWVILPYYRIAVNGDAGRITVDKDSTSAAACRIDRHLDSRELLRDQENFVGGACCHR